MEQKEFFQQNQPKKKWMLARFDRDPEHEGIIMANKMVYKLKSSTEPRVCVTRSILNGISHKRTFFFKRVASWNGNL